MANQSESNVVKKLKVDIDVSQVLKGLKAIQREAKKASAALKGLQDLKQEEESNSKLLVIELEDENCVPKVFYKGEEITRKINVFFDWQTRTSAKPGKLNIHIKYADVGSGKPSVKGIVLEK